MHICAAGGSDSSGRGIGNQLPLNKSHHLAMEEMQSLGHKGKNVLPQVPGKAGSVQQEVAGNTAAVTWLPRTP